MSEKLPSYAPPEAKVCADMRHSINAALKMLCRKRVAKGKEEVEPSIVDSVVEDIGRLRDMADQMREKAEDPDTPKPEVYITLANRYDQLSVDAQLKLMHLGVVAANNEQLALDRQVLTRERLISEEKRWKMREEQNNRDLRDATEPDAAVEMKRRIRLMNDSKVVDAQFERKAP